jgi:hypothetical protein
MPDEMAGNMETIEAVRKRFLPKRIATLFVGESAPHSGDFFYYGKNAMSAHMKRAVELAFGKSDDDFLKAFQAYGWYLDDLVLEPVDHLPKPQRIARCLDWQKALLIELRRIGREQLYVCSSESSHLCMPRQLCQAATPFGTACPFPAWGSSYASKPRWRRSSGSFQD